MGYGEVSDIIISQRGSALAHFTRNKRFQESIQRFRSNFLQEHREKLFNALPAKELERVVSEEVRGWRDRLYAPLVTLRLFIEQVLHADPACQNVVVRYACERAAQGKAEISRNTGPYCQARQRLPLSLLTELCEMTSKRLEDNSPAHWKWRGRSVKMVDGTTVSMPDTKESQAAYPQSGEQKAGLGFPLARLVVVISLGTSAVLDWAMGPCKGKQTGEDGLFRQLFGSLAKGDILLADRYYSGYIMVAMLQSLGIDVVTRQHARRVTDFRRGKRLGKHDHLVRWKRPPRPAWLDEEVYAEIPEEMTVREARIGKWVIVSTLIDSKQVDKAELNRLYVQRWHIELDLRAIKSTMGMNILRCKSPHMVQKEVGAFLLAYNLIRAAMAQAAVCAKVLPRQLSFSGAKRVLGGFMDMCRGGKICSSMFAYLRGAISRLLLPCRPNRVEPRAIKRRPKPQKLLTVPREIARAKLRRAHRNFA
jgi:hypothetical protein